MENRMANGLVIYLIVPYIKGLEKLGEVHAILLVQGSSFTVPPKNQNL